MKAIMTKKFMMTSEYICGKCCINALDETAGAAKH